MKRESRIPKTPIVLPVSSMLLLAFVGCGLVSGPDGVSARTDRAVYPPGATATVTVSNRTRGEIRVSGPGCSFLSERMDPEGWVEIGANPTVQQVCPQDFTIGPDGSREFQLRIWDDGFYEEEEIYRFSIFVESGFESFLLRSSSFRVQQAN